MAAMLAGSEKRTEYSEESWGGAILVVLGHCPELVSRASQKRAVLALGLNDGIRQDGLGMQVVLCSRAQNY